MPRTLSKSDFKLAQDCPAKLYYRERHYPTMLDSDPYLRLLSDGGYMVEKIAKLLYPDGIAMEYSHTDPETAAERTMEMIRSADHIVLFEATLLSGAKQARVDILVKRGDEFDLLEVKAKSWNGAEAQARAAESLPVPFRTKKGAIIPEWQPYLDDVTFQVMVLKELFPAAVVHPYLIMPDKSKTTAIDELYSFFTIQRHVLAGSPIEQIDVGFTGDAPALRQDHFLTVVPVAAEVDELLEAVRLKSIEYLASLQPELVRIATPISVCCKDCEFRGVPGDDRDGFLECWGALGRVEPHLFDMNNLSTIGGGKNPVADKLIAAGKVSLFDIDPCVLKKMEVQ